VESPQPAATSEHVISLDRVEEIIDIEFLGPRIECGNPCRSVQISFIHSLVEFVLDHVGFAGTGAFTKQTHRHIFCTIGRKSTPVAVFEEYIGLATQTIGVSGKPIYQPSLNFHGTPFT